MPDRMPDDWRSATASECEAQFSATEVIGEHLRFMFDRTLTEPLPEQIEALLTELQRNAASGPKG